MPAKVHQQIQHLHQLKLSLLPPPPRFYLLCETVTSHTVGTKVKDLGQLVLRNWLGNNLVEVGFVVSPELCKSVCRVACIERRLLRSNVESVFPHMRYFYFTKNVISKPVRSLSCAILDRVLNLYIQ